MPSLRHFVLALPLSAAASVVSGQQPEAPQPLRTLNAVELRYAGVDDLLPPPPILADDLPPPPIAVNAGSVLAEASPECVISEAACCPGGPLRRHWHHRLKPHLQYSHWGYPAEFCERPFGSYTHMAMAGQIGSGYSAQMTLYRFDFVAFADKPGAQLNAKGNARLARLAELLAITPYPLVIEPDDNYPQINAARRQHVLAQLQRLTGDGFPAERVIVRSPLARGISAEEAILIQENVLRQVQSGAQGGLGVGEGMNAGGGSSSDSQQSSGNSQGNY